MKENTRGPALDRPALDRSSDKMKDEFPMGGDHEARQTLTESEFMKLFLQHEPVLRCVARSMLNDWHLIDDVVQEAGVTMWEKIDQLQDTEGFLHWARVIVRFKCHSAINAARRSRLVLSDQAIKKIADQIDNVDREQYETTLEALQNCLKQLQPQQRELVLTPYRSDVQIQQIADSAGHSANSLYKKIGRLREKLSACVEQAIQLEMP